MSTRPMAQSKATISRIPGLGEIDLAPFGVKVPKPGFVIVTGDMNEFGGGSGCVGGIPVLLEGVPRSRCTTGWATTTTPGAPT